MLIQEALRTSTCYVSCLDERVVAYAILDYSFFSRGFLSTLVVQSDYRRRGIGSRLLHYLACRCTSPRLFAVTKETDSPMQEFLSSQKFYLSGIIYNVDELGPFHVYMRECSALGKEKTFEQPLAPFLE
jgi:ribosomal protein S18 acetylase RimI-like enzyme